MGWTYPASARIILPPLLILTPVGMVLVLVWETVRSRSREGAFACLRAWRSRAWLTGTLRIWLAVLLTTHAYMWLKLFTPFLNGALCDATIWRLEERLFLGYSPNLFILELFRDPGVLCAVDWSYPRLFRAGVYLTMAVFPALPSNRLRYDCTASFVLLWTLGGWLHVLLPAMGPCFWAPSAWGPYADQLKESAATQAALLRNYKELLVYRFSSQLSINPLYGVGAIPSMHNASQALLAFWAMRLSRPAGLLCWGTVVVIFFGSVITGWHYLIDAVAGILLAASVFLAGRLIAAQGRVSRP